MKTANMRVFCPNAAPQAGDHEILNYTEVRHAFGSGNANASRVIRNINDHARAMMPAKARKKDETP